MNIKVISRNVGYALLVSALFMFLSILVSVANGNDSALAALMISFTITFTVGVFPFIFVRKSAGITLKDGYMIIALSWLLSFIFGMLPYALWGGPFTIINAWFESVSGFTTTGSTIWTMSRHCRTVCFSGVPRRTSSEAWESWSFLLLIIPSSSQMRLRLTTLELSSLSKREYISGGTRQSISSLMFYFGLTAASFLLYADGRDESFRRDQPCDERRGDRRLHTRNLSIGAYNSVSVDLITMLFMLLSSIHFGMILRGCRDKIPQAVQERDIQVLSFHDGCGGGDRVDLDQGTRVRGGLGALLPLRLLPRHELCLDDRVQHR